MPHLRLAALLALACLPAAIACSGSVPPPTPAPPVATEAAAPSPQPSPTPAAVASAPTPSPEPAELPPPAPLAPVPEPGPAEPAEAEHVRVANTEGTGVNVRAEPSSGAALVMAVPEGAELEVVGPDREADGRTWRNVRDPTDGAEGWVAAEFLAPVP